MSLSFRVLFPIATLVGSGLLFIAQPMIGKMLLPRVGGAPAAWTTSVLFFQAVLLTGYGYAHWLSKRPWEARIAIHGAILLLALGVLPFSIADRAPAEGSMAPALWILQALVLAVGAPLFALSSSAPLLQSWLSDTSLPGGRDPYFLYAASNTGSLIALCAYPVLVEPSIGLERQGALWAWGYGAYVVLALACAARAWRARPRGEASPLPETDTAPPSVRHRLLWVGLAAAPASLMLGVTSSLTADLAAAPFVWVLTLGLYLVTYALAFSPRAVVPAGLAARILPIAAVVFLMLLMTRATEPLAVVVPAHLAVLFIAALSCHSELHRLRPHPRHLTAFYALIGLGGTLGGVFNSLVAPILFDEWTELPLAFVCICLLAPPALAPVPAGKHKKKRSPPHSAIVRSDVAIPVALGLTTFLLAKLADILDLSGQSRDLLAIGLPVLLTYLASERRNRFALAVAAVLWASSLDTSREGPPVFSDRSFFGAHRVTTFGGQQDGGAASFHQLYHGTTLHGAQRVAAKGGPPVDSREPLTYYTPTSPIGRVLRHPARVARRVGLVGLGAGSLFAYAEPGETWTVFEIDPVVRRIAEDERYFSFLPEAKRRGAEVDLMLGDARLTLGAADGSFDVLVLDAFSSGSIPTHLLTREAFELYLDQLAPDGLLALHVSNRHLDIAPLVRATARELQLEAVVADGPPGPDGSQRIASRWAFLARNAEALRARGLTPEELFSYRERGPVWTDDRADLWSLFQW